MRKVILSIVVLLSLAFLMQGFQCASREMVTAKTEYAKKNYVAAVENLERELANNPQNEEALMLLIKIKLDQGELQQAAKILNDAETKVVQEKNKKLIPQYKQQLWINCYNNGRSKYLNYFNSGDKSDLDSAVFYINTGIIANPEFLDFYNLKAFAYREMGDTAKTIETFEKYISMLDDEIRFATENQIHWSMLTQEAIDRLKIETNVSIDTTQNGNLLRTDNGSHQGQEIYISSYSETKEDDFKVLGFRVNLPEQWTETEKSNFFEFKLDAFRIVAQHYFSKNELRKSLEVSKQYQKLDPFDRDMNNFVVQIYQELGQEQDAIEELQNLITKNPDNELYRLLLADLFANLESYEKAIETYNRAIKINPEYGIAYRNLGSTYKNKASSIQKKEQEKQEEDKDYEIDREKYFPFLEKSAESFENALKTEDYEGNPEVLSELAEIYHITDKEDKLKKTLAKLENVEPRVPDYFKERYYYNLLRIYSDRKNKSKTDQITRKLEAFQNG